MTFTGVIKKSMITSLVAAVIGLVVAFGGAVSADQTSAVLGFTGTLCSFIIAAGIFGAHFVEDEPVDADPS